LAARLSPDPLGELAVLPRAPSCIGGREGEGREEERRTVQGEGGKVG